MGCTGNESVRKVLHLGSKLKHSDNLLVSWWRMCYPTTFFIKLDEYLKDLISMDTNSDKIE